MMKNLVVVGRLFWQLGTRFSGRCLCREVKTRVNVWTVRWIKKVAFVESDGRWWSFDCISLLLGKILTDQLLLDWHIVVLTK